MRQECVSDNGPEFIASSACVSGALAARAMSSTSLLSRKT